MRFPRGRWWTVARVAGLAAVGAAGGYLYYAWVGCSSGGCPLTSNPLVTTGVGAALGLSMGWPEGREPKAGGSADTGTGPATGAGQGGED
jgi:hypothetical protein